MYINNKFLAELFKEEGSFYYEGERLFTQNLEVGAIAIDDGTLLFADPYAVNRGIKVCKDIPKGIYPVHVYSGVFPPHEEHKIFSVVIRLKDEVPDRFQMAMPASMTVKDFPGDQYCGVNTKSGNITFMDEATCLSLMTNVEDSADLMKEMEEKISMTYFEMGGMADVKLPDEEKNFMTFVAGNDIGGYPIYLGYANNECVAVVVDFLLID